MLTFTSPQSDPTAVFNICLSLQEISFGANVFHKKNFVIPTLKKKILGAKLMKSGPLRQDECAAETAPAPSCGR